MISKHVTSSCTQVLQVLQVLAPVSIGKQSTCPAEQHIYRKPTPFTPPTWKIILCHNKFQKNNTEEHWVMKIGCCRSEFSPWHPMGSMGNLVVMTSSLIKSIPSTWRAYQLHPEFHCTVLSHISENHCYMAHWLSVIIVIKRDAKVLSINQTSKAPLSLAKPGSVAWQTNQCSTASFTTDFPHMHPRMRSLMCYNFVKKVSDVKKFGFGKETWISEVRNQDYRVKTWIIYP